MTRRERKRKARLRRRERKKKVRLFFPKRNEAKRRRKRARRFDRRDALYFPGRFGYPASTGRADAGYPARFPPARLSGSYVRCLDRFTIPSRRYTPGTSSAGTTGATPRTAVLAPSPSSPAPRPRSRFAGARASRGPCRASLEPQKGNTRFTKLRAPARPDPACAAFFSRSTHNVTQQHILTRVASRTPHLRRPFLFSPRRCQRASREAPVDR